MRKGINPEKSKGEKNRRYRHRIIIPVYIPNLEEDYYKESFEVFKVCLDSLINSINNDYSSITLINNASIPIVEDYLNKFLNNGLIDKKVSFSENKGKVYAVLAEAKAAFEPYVTIADADVYFCKGWENAVSEVFEKVPRAGVVSPAPSPHMAFYHNVSVFSDLYLMNKLGYDKRVDDEDCELFLKGMGNDSLFERSGRPFNWKQKQYYLKGGSNSIVGAVHFVATYRSSIFRDSHLFPAIKFENGYEEDFLDRLADIRGWYRLSLSQTCAYHMGNKLESDGVFFIKSNQNKLSSINFDNNEPVNRSKTYAFRSIIFKSLKRFRNL